MKIEARKYYKTRDGRKVGPMKLYDDANPPFDWTTDAGGTWSHSGEDGLATGPMGSPTKGDLIAEWTDEQIGTLEELGVKPGDVVENVSHERYKGIQWTCYDAHPKGYTDQPCAVYHKGEISGFIYIHNRDEYKFRLISRATPTPSIDLTAITTPFGLLDKATQDALVAHGGPYQWYDGNGWRYSSPTWARAGVYRVKSGPKRETVTKGAWLDRVTGEVTVCDECNCTITYDTIDGEIDMATYKVTKK